LRAHRIHRHLAVDRSGARSRHHPAHQPGASDREPGLSADTGKLHQHDREGVLMTDICVGLISGTSLDGIDVAVCGIDGHAQEAEVELLAFDTIAWPDAVRAELLRLYDDQTDAVARICALNVIVGERFAEAAKEVLE